MQLAPEESLGEFVGEKDGDGLLLQAKCMSWNRSPFIPLSMG